MNRFLLVAIPSYDGTHSGFVTTHLLQQAAKHLDFDFVSDAGSFLTWNFNSMWCAALNQRAYTHFVMWHPDIEPQLDWLEKLVDLADQHEADILSAVIAIKSQTGETSTALARGKDFGDYRRLCLSELKDLPDVFGEPELSALFGWTTMRRLILVNTGLMCVRMVKRTVLETMRFTVNNWIIKDKNGKFQPLSEPEDWEWSRRAQEKGLKVLATKAIKAEHIGRFGYPNAIENG